MNFDFSESQEAVAALAEQVFSGSADADRVAEVERTEERFDRDLWAALAGSDLLGVAIGEEHGGLGLGMVETALVLREQGRRVAPVPLWPTLVLGAMPIAEFGTPELKDRWLGAVASGKAVLTGALSEWGANDALSPSVTAARRDDGSWELNGSKPAVPAAGVADAVVVPARVAGGDQVAVFVVELDADGVEVSLSETTSREFHGELTLRSVVVGEDAALDGADGRTIVEWMLARAQVAVAAVALGCCEEATAMAAAYTSAARAVRAPPVHQPGGGHAGGRLLYRHRLHEGHTAPGGLADRRGSLRPKIADAAAVAKWWSADAGQRVVHATQHLHGGMGADVDYPVHRYFLWVKQLENTFGGASRQLAAIGRSLAG